MIHPSTMAGPNWFTGSFGTTHPFQSSGSPFFRNTPFQGPSGGFGPGNNPFQNQTFGFGGSPLPFQNVINEIISQTVPTTLASFGIPTSGYQPSFGPQTSFGYQTSFGPQGSFGFSSPWNFPNQAGPGPFGSSFQNSNWLNPSFFTEIIRQATNQAIQNPWQSNMTSFSPFASSPSQPFFGFSPTGTSQELTNFIGQICQQACQQACATLIQAVTACVNECTNAQNTPSTFGTNWQQQNIGNVIGQICQQACQATCQTVCQAVFTCVNETLNAQNRSSNIPFGAPTGFGINPQQQQQNIWNFVGQICQQACQQTCTTLCQAVATCVNESINSQSRTGSTPFFNTTNIPFRTPGAPFNFNTTSQYGIAPGIPTGAGAF
jgi:hypothetical protein